MTLQGKTTYNKTVALSPELHARFVQYQLDHGPGASFNGLVIEYLNEALPHLLDEEAPQ